MEQSTETRGLKRDHTAEEDPVITAKRSNNIELGSSNKENQPIGLLGSDGFGVNDYISRLPEDDMLEIFKHLSRIDIFHLMPVNKKIYNVTRDRTLNHIKWKFGKLFIYQTEDSFCFKMRAIDDCPFILNNYCSYTYQIGKRDGIEKRGFDETEMFAREIASNVNVEEWKNVPSNFFTALSEVLLNRDPESVNVEEMQVDASFFAGLQRAFEGHEIGYLDLWNIRFCDNDAKQGLQRLARSLKKLVVADASELSMLTEAFVVDVSSGTSRLSELTWRGPPTHDEHYRRAFTASPSISLSLLRFYKLDLPTMIISSTWAAELIMQHMDAIDKPSPEHGSWRFQLDQPITSGAIGQQIRKEDYEVDEELGNFIIIRKRDGFTARFYVQDYSVMERSATIWMLFVDFYRISA